MFARGIKSAFQNSCLCDKETMFLVWQVFVQTDQKHLCEQSRKTKVSTSSRPPLMPTQSLSLISVYASVWLWLLHSQSVVWVLVAGRQHYDIPGAQISIWALTRFHSCFSLERTFGPPLLASHTDWGPALFATTEAKLQYCHSSWAPIIPLNTPCAASFSF